MADIVNPLPLTAGEMKIQQDAIDRQRKIAEYLQQSSLTPDQGQMVSGHYVKPSATQYLAKLAQGLLGRTQQTSLDNKQLALATQQGDALRGQFGVGGNGPENPAAPMQDNQPTPIQDAPSMPLGSGMNSANTNGIVGTDKIAAALLNNPEQPQSAPSQSPQAPVSSTSTGSRLIPGMSPMTAFQLYNSDPKTYDAAFLRQFDAPDALKINRAYGITNAEGATATRAEMKKKGMLEIAPGNTAIDLTNDKRIVGAQFDKGISGGYDANGNPTISKIAGSNAIAELVGDQKRAEAAGAAGYDMVTINTPNGPVMMTKEQAAKQSGGVPSNSVNFTGSNGTKMNFDGLSPQQIFERVQKIGDPKLTQTFNEWAQSKNDQPKNVGIKLQDEAGVEQGKGKGKFFSDTYSDIQKQAMTSHQTTAKLQRLSQMVDGIDTGKFTGTALEIKKAAKAAGFDLGIADNVAPLEAARALTSELALIARNPDSGMGMPGAMSNEDRSFLTNMQPGIEATKEGRKLMIESVMKIEQRKQEIAKLARNYKNGELDNGFFQAVQDYADSHPLFSEVKSQPVQPTKPAPKTDVPNYQELYGIKVK